METFNYSTSPTINNGLVHNLKIQKFVNSEITKLNSQELFLIYEMIRLMKKPKIQQNIKKNVEFSFIEAQNALKGITGNLSDDIINIEREERI